MNKIILNKTRSSSARWYLESPTDGMFNAVLINGKNRYPVGDFFLSDHAEKETVRQYMINSGMSDFIPSEKLLASPPSWTLVETSVEDSTLPAEVVAILADPVSRAERMQQYFTQLNGTKGKGATRKLRRSLAAAGHPSLAALRAA